LAVALNRREFLYALAWFPFFWRRRSIELAGIRFRIVRHGHSSRRYLHIHGNENTAREVLLRHMRTHAGIAYLIQSTTRNVEIEGGQLDPNRMFSRVGAEKNLRMLNPQWPPDRLEKALNRLDRGRDKFVRHLFPPPGGLLIALHNNAEYSVKDEVSASDRVALSDPDHPHDFCLCTSPADFEIIAKSPYNVVLQNTAPAEDDGSLSRLAAKRNIRYVNIEASHGNFDKQAAILEWLDTHL
jgi:hypothetical protein